MLVGVRGSGGKVVDLEGHFPVRTRGDAEEVRYTPEYIEIYVGKAVSQLTPP